MCEVSQGTCYTSQIHCRYKIEELVEQGDFTDSAYLLLHGELPSSAEKHSFERDLTRHTLVHEQLIQFYKGFRHDAHPMAIMVGVVGALSAFYNDARVGAAAEFEYESEASARHKQSFDRSLVLHTAHQHRLFDWISGKLCKSMTSRCWPFMQELEAAGQSLHAADCKDANTGSNRIQDCHR